jgi:hypothetical protein
MLIKMENQVKQKKVINLFLFFIILRFIFVYTFQIFNNMYFCAVSTFFMLCLIDAFLANDGYVNDSIKKNKSHSNSRSRSRSPHHSRSKSPRHRYHSSRNDYEEDSKHRDYGHDRKSSSSNRHRSHHSRD